MGRSVREGSRRDICLVRVTDLPEHASTVYAVTRVADQSKALRAFLAALTRVGEEIQGGLSAQ